MSAVPTDSTYQAPDELYKVMSQIEYEEGLAADDPRYVDTLEARNSQGLFKIIQRKFGWWAEAGQVMSPERKHLLFFGHIGSGKTTELRHYAKQFNESGLFAAVEVNINAELDRQNLQFPDLVMAMAKTLLQRLENEAIVLGTAQLQPLYDWFSKTVQTRLDERTSQVEVKAGVESKLSVPLLGSLFANLTSLFRTGVTYRTEIRNDIRNNFGQLATAFSEFMHFAEQALQSKYPQLRRVLFILDGTDKLRDEDAKRLFVSDLVQMDLVQALVIYTAPLHLAYEHNLQAEKIVLPMIKTYERDGQRCAAGWRALRELLLRRADRRLFVDETTIDQMLDICGGHPRELLRLLKYCCEVADTRIDQTTVTRATQELAAEYRRFLAPEDYALLVAKDTNPQHTGNDERTKILLYRLALLEYNHGSWQRSHPVVRTLEGYQKAQAVWLANVARGSVSESGATQG